MDFSCPECSQVGVIWLSLQSLSRKLKNWALLLVCSSSWTATKAVSGQGPQQKQKCREERREKGEEFVLSINVKLSISQLQAHEKETSWLLPCNSNLTNPPQNTQRQGKKRIFLLQFHEIRSPAELREFAKLLNTYADWYQFLFFISSLPDEQYIWTISRVCVLRETKHT